MELNVVINMIHQPMLQQRELRTQGAFVIQVGQNQLLPVSSAPIIPSCQFPTHVLAERTDWKDIESRQAYMEACVEQDIAWQIKLTRKKRSLTQRQLAKKLNTKQSSVARWEDPLYGRHSIPCLIKIAHAFDCALSIRLIPYSKFAEITKDTSDDVFVVDSYESEIKELSA